MELQWQREEHRGGGQATGKQLGFTEIQVREAGQLCAVAAPYRNADHADGGRGRGRGSVRQRGMANGNGRRHKWQRCVVVDVDVDVDVDAVDSIDGY